VGLLRRSGIKNTTKRKHTESVERKTKNNEENKVQDDSQYKFFFIWNKRDKEKKRKDSRLCTVHCVASDKGLEKGRGGVKQ